MNTRTTPDSSANANQVEGAHSSFSLAGKMFASRRDNMDLLKALFLSLVVTALFYEVFPLPFIDQPWVLGLFEPAVSEVIMGMTIWSCFLLFFKYLYYRLQVKSQQAFTSEPAIAAILSQGIYARNADELTAQLVGELRRLGVRKFEYSAIFRRISQVLHFVRSAPKKESVTDMLGFQANIDVKKMESSFTVLQVFIWAIPILGFIGTVWGIGDSVRSFSEFIQTAEGGAQFSTQMRGALGGVTSGLAVAFNTTFLALVLVIPVMMATSILQKNEEEILLFVEEYCLEELLPHLHIAPSNDAVTENFDEHMHRILQLSSTWLGQLEPLVNKLARESEMVSNQLAGIQPLVKDFTDRLMDGERGAQSPAPRSASKTTATTTTTRASSGAASRKSVSAAAKPAAKSAKKLSTRTGRGAGNPAARAARPSRKRGD